MHQTYGFGADQKKKKNKWIWWDQGIHIYHGVVPGLSPNSGRTAIRCNFPLRCTLPNKLGFWHKWWLLMHFQRLVLGSSRIPTTLPSASIYMTLNSPTLLHYDSTYISMFPSPPAKWGCTWRRVLILLDSLIAISLYPKFFKQLVTFNIYTLWHNFAVV